MNNFRTVVSTTQFLFELITYPIEIRPDSADQADENFRALCTGRPIAGPPFVTHGRHPSNSSISIQLAGDTEGKRNC
jgi:hypothetical protein